MYREHKPYGYTLLTFALITLSNDANYMRPTRGDGHKTVFKSFGIVIDAVSKPTARETQDFKQIGKYQHNIGR